MAKPDLLKGDPATLFPRAIAAMQNKPLLDSVTWQNQQLRAAMDGAHPLIIEFKRKLIKRFAGMGIPMFCVEMVRSYHEQASAYARGVSKDSPADGLWPHMAFAVDIIHSKRGWDMPRECWAVVGHVGKEVAASMGIKIVWGGDWKFWDPAHFELEDWKRIAREGDKYWQPTPKLYPRGDTVVPAYPRSLK